MRPYLALIKDSFRAAIASRILYVLLAVITLLLLVIAPLHVREVLDWQLKFGNNVTKPHDLARRIVERGEDPEYPAVNHVWSFFSSNLKSDLKEMIAYQDDESTMPDSNRRVMHEMNTIGSLEDELNEIIQKRDFYKEEAWASKRLNSEARELLDGGVESISNERLRRLNRLLMASAFAGMIKRGTGNALEIWYGPAWQWTAFTFSISHSDFAAGTLATVTWFFDKFVMSVGLLIAILVTANIIPETFLPGSLNLLLSKPISRWGLLVAKFAGGCVLISLCAAYLFLGLWLWLGLGMGIWDRGILWGIPLYIVVFAIYYSVSTLVGVWWRSPILSVIVTGLFWAVCFLVGLTYQVIQGRLDNSKTRDLVSVGNTLLQVGELNSVFEWDENGRTWDQKLEMKMGEEHRIAMGAVMFAPGAGDDGDIESLAPTFDPKHDRILAGMINLMNPSQTNHKDLYVSATDKIDFKEIGKFPRNTAALFPDKDGVIAVDNSGQFHRFTGPPAQIVETTNESENESKNESKDKDQESTATDDEKSGFESLAGSLFKKRKKSKDNQLFESIGPENGRVGISRKNHVTWNPVTRDILVFSSGEISKFVIDEDGKYQRAGEPVVVENIAGDTRVILNAASDSVVLALGNGDVLVLDAETLEPRKRYQPQRQSPWRHVKASGNGRYFALYCRNQTVWLLDTQNAGQIYQPAIWGQGSITATGFDEQNRLWVASRSNQASLVDLDDLNSVKSVSPSTGWLGKTFYYFLEPLYTVFPKPGEFYKLVSYLSSTQDQSESEINLENVSDTADPWQPLWSGLLFMCGTLFVASAVFHLRDF